jgi:7-cyano-7-deazaguanine reductase
MKKNVKTLTLLGNSQAAFPSTPSASIIEVFPNRYPGRNYRIRFQCSEFTSLCPVTGQPDYATLEIEYIPGPLCIETKSLKFYLASYRAVKDFNENIANQILDDLQKACQPRQMQVQASFHQRGGIALSVCVQNEEEVGEKI